MKSVVITKLRDKNSGREEFRKLTDMLSDQLAFEVMESLPKVSLFIDTPIKKTVGDKLLNRQVIIPILRAGLAMLPSFLRVFPEANVGFLGLRRDEITFDAKMYYENLPPITSSTDVIILDPMIATGGSAIVSLNLVKERHADPHNIYYAGIIAAPEGIQKIQEHSPKVKIFAAQIDDGLNEHKFIVPGLGDFGDRYFGTENELS